MNKNLLGLALVLLLASHAFADGYLQNPGDAYGYVVRNFRGSGKLVFIHGNDYFEYYDDGVYVPKYTKITNIDEYVQSRGSRGIDSNDVTNKYSKTPTLAGASSADQQIQPVAKAVDNSKLPPPQTKLIRGSKQSLKPVATVADNSNLPPPVVRSIPARTQPVQQPARYIGDSGDLCPIKNQRGVQVINITSGDQLLACEKKLAKKAYVKHFGQCPRCEKDLRALTGAGTLYDSLAARNMVILNIPNIGMKVTYNGVDGKTYTKTAWDYGRATRLREGSFFSDNMQPGNILHFGNGDQVGLGYITGYPAFATQKVAEAYPNDLSFRVAAAPIAAPQPVVQRVQAPLPAPVSKPITSMARVEAPVQAPAISRAAVSSTIEYATEKAAAEAMLKKMTDKTYKGRDTINVVLGKEKDGQDLIAEAELHHWKVSENKCRERSDIKGQMEDAQDIYYGSGRFYLVTGCGINAIQVPESTINQVDQSLFAAVKTYAEGKAVKQAEAPTPPVPAEAQSAK